MKIRNGFVSNSSSSSFILCTDDLNEEQINKVLDIQNEKDWRKSWGGKVSRFKKFLIGCTCMDNLGIEKLFKELKIQTNQYSIIGNDRMGWVMMDFMKGVMNEN